MIMQQPRRQQEPISDPGERQRYYLLLVEIPGAIEARCTKHLPHSRTATQPQSRRQHGKSSTRS
jgi:hypothetical protein